MDNDRTTVLVNQRPFHFEEEVLSPNDFRSAVELPAEYEVWKIIKAPDPEGQLPLDDIQITEPVSIQNGERYRVVPPGTFGLITLPIQLVDEVRVLQQEGRNVELIEGEGWANIVFRDYPLPAGLSKSFTDLLLRFPISYPNGRPDMFWTDVDLALKDGQCPKSADTVETAVGRQWRRFSWHPQVWNPATDDLRTYLEFVNTRLARTE